MSGTHEMSYPEAPRLDLTEDIFGHQVSDPYRWMEDADSAERTDWLRAEAELFSAERAHWPGRDILAERVRELLNVGVVGTPVWRGERCFFTRREPGQEHAVLCTQVADGPVEVLVDPMAIDPSGLTTLDAWQPDKEGRLLAYQLSEGGDEESLLRVLDVETGSVVDGPIDRCRYSNVAWLPGGKAFYYTRRLPAFSVPDGESQYHRRVYLHQVGTPADEEDVLIFGTGRDKTDYYYASVSRDGRWLFLSASRGTAPRNDLYLADLFSSDPAAPELLVVQEGGAAGTDCGGGSGFGDFPRRLAGPDCGGCRGGAGRVRDPGRARAGAAGAAGVVEPARAERDHRARPGFRCVADVGRTAGPGHGRRAERAAGGRARGVVRVYGLHHAAAGAAVRRAIPYGGDMGRGAGVGGGPGRDGASGDVPVGGRDFGG